jgi:drug/metabolite transporter (DMT)-like permease
MNELPTGLTSTELLLFAGVLAVMFYFGLKRKPPAHEEDRWVWWVAMLALGTAIAYLLLRGLEFI